jgi:hypothetical protein
MSNNWITINNYFGRNVDGRGLILKSRASSGRTGENIKKPPYGRMVGFPVEI